MADRLPALTWPLVLSLVLAACSAAPAAPADDVPDPDGEFTTVAPGQFFNLDPQRTVNNPQVFKVYEGLLRFDPSTLRPVPAAAREMPTLSADGKTYRFRLRDGLTYSDGAPLTAGDFAFGISRLCDPAIGDQPTATVAYRLVGCREWHSLDVQTATPERYAQLRAALLAGGIRALSSTELELTLTEPAPWFLNYLTTSAHMPVRERDVVRGGPNWWKDPALYIGNGPFVLKERLEKDGLVVTANPRARIPPKLKKWTTRSEPDEAARLAMYRRGEVDSFIPGWASLAEIEQDPSLRADLVTAPASCTAFARFNTLRAPFDDPKVRLAFARSIDRDAYVREVERGEPALSLIPPGLPGHDAGDRVQAFDPAEARRLLDGSRYAGRPELAGLRFTFDESAAFLKLQLEWFARQWRTNLGIDVTLNPVGSATLTELFGKVPEERPPLVLAAWCPDYAHQQFWLGTVFRPGRLNYRWEDGRYHELVRQADRELDGERADRLYREASRLLSSEAAGAWIGYFDMHTLKKPWVGGVVPNALDPRASWDPGNVYVTKRKPR